MPPYICMSPIHKQHKESMLCQTKGLSICPHRFRCHHMLGYQLYVGMPPLRLDAAICLDAPPVCLNATLCLNTPICLDTPVCLDVPICLDTFIYLDAHLYVWTYPICLHSPYVWMPLYVWVSLSLDTPLYGWTSPHVWTPPVYLDVLHMFGFPCVFGCGYPNIWQCPNVLGASKINITKKACFVRLRGCPYAPIDLDATICLDTTCVLGCHLYV